MVEAARERQQQCDGDGSDGGRGNQWWRQWQRERAVALGKMLGSWAEAQGKGGGSGVAEAAVRAAKVDGSGADEVG